MAPVESGDCELRLKTLILKKEYLFNKVQKAYDLSKTLRMDSLDSVQRFLVQYSELDDARSDFEKIVMDIVVLELQLMPDSKPSTSALDSFDDLYYACKRVALNCEKLDQERSTNLRKINDDSNLGRPSLPKLTLIEFDGQIENWTTFYDTFVSLVHNRSFDDIDKFHYLLSCVKGPALNMVKNLPITANNYAVVWQSLLEKYQDQRALTGRYLDRMLGFTPLTKDSVANLTSFIETFDHSLKAIKALKIRYLDDYLFCHIALRGLDSHTRKLFEESRDQNELPSFNELIDFVNNQIKVLEHAFPSTSSWTTSTQNKTQSDFIPNKFSTPPPSYKPAQSYNTNYNKQFRSPQVPLKVGLTTSRNDTHNFNKLACVHCNLNHMIYRCEQFRKLLVQDRIDRVNFLKLCTNCLKAGHNSSECRSNMTCGVCSSPHHYLLHRDASAPSAVLTPQSFRSDAGASSAVLTPQPFRADAGASSAVLTPQPSRSNACVAEISPSHSVSVDADSDVAVIESLHSVNEDANYGVVLGTTRIHITDVAGQPQNCRAVLDSGAQSSFITLDCAQRLGLRRNKCPYTVSGLGDDEVKNYGIITCDIKPCKSDVPSLSVDMVVVAKVSSEMPNISFPRKVVEEYKHFDLADPLFHEKSAVDILLGNDVVSELIKDKPVNIKSNIPKVIETVFGFVVSGKLYYDSQLNSQNFHLTVCQEKTLRDFWEVEELPCNPVLSPLDQLAEDIYANKHSHDDSGRYVFDASTKTSTNVSLNDFQLSWPNCRLFEDCFANDICKTYRAILIRESDRKYQRILYRSSVDELIPIFELKTITHGVSSSPSLAGRTLLQLASDECERFPSAAAVIRQGIYIDYALWSCETFSQAFALQDELVNMFRSAGLIHQKWSSNSKELLESLPVEPRETSISFERDKNDMSLKLLGLKWVPLADAFSFSVNKQDPVITNRSVLKILTSIYDSVGFISPCTFVAKYIIQDLWKLGIGWDAQLPNNVCQQWLEFIFQLPRLSELQIERHALLPGITECELVGCCDASSRGYASSIYDLSRHEHQAVLTTNDLNQAHDCLIKVIQSTCFNQKKKL